MGDKLFSYCKFYSITADIPRPYTNRNRWRGHSKHACFKLCCVFFSKCSATNHALKIFLDLLLHCNRKCRCLRIMLYNCLKGITDENELKLVPKHVHIVKNISGNVTVVTYTDLHYPRRLPRQTPPYDPTLRRFPVRGPRRCKSSTVFSSMSNACARYVWPNSMWPNVQSTGYRQTLLDLKINKNFYAQDIYF